MTSTTLIFREATPVDLPGIVAMLADDMLGSAREALDTDLPQSYYTAFDAIAADPNNELIVAELDDSLIGTCQLTYIPSLSHQGSWRMKVESVRIAGHVRGQGYGKRMMAFAFERAKARGVNIVQLTSNLKRSAAIRFYEQLGFTHSHAGMKKMMTDE